MREMRNAERKPKNSKDYSIEGRHFLQRDPVAGLMFKMTNLLV